MNELTPAQQAFFDAIDEVPRTPRTLMIQGRQGELRHIPISALATLGRREFRSRTPRLDKRRNLLALLTAQLEKEDRGS